MYLSAFGATPFSQRHWACEASGLIMPPRMAVKVRVLSKFFFIGTEFDYIRIVMVGLRMDKSTYSPYRMQSVST